MTEVLVSSTVLILALEVQVHLEAELGGALLAQELVVLVVGVGGDGGDGALGHVRSSTPRRLRDGGDGPLSLP